MKHFAKARRIVSAAKNAPVSRRSPPIQNPGPPWASIHDRRPAIGSTQETAYAPQPGPAIRYQRRCGASAMAMRLFKTWGASTKPSRLIAAHLLHQTPDNAEADYSSSSAVVWSHAQAAEAEAETVLAAGRSRSGSEAIRPRLCRISATASLSRDGRSTKRIRPRTARHCGVDESGACRGSALNTFSALSCILEHGQFADAAEALRRAEELMPTAVMTLTALATAENALGHTFGAAERVLQRIALSIEPGNLEARHMLACSAAEARCAKTVARRVIPQQ